MQKLEKLNILWQHPKTQAKFYVGNEKAAESLEILEQHQIFNIICAKGSFGHLIADMRQSHLYHKDDERFVYLPFHIESMPRLMDHL